MTVIKYHAPISDLIDASALPGNFQAFENLLQEGIDIILGKIFYKDFTVEVSASADRKLYSLTIVTKVLRIPLFSGMNLVLFKGSETTFSDFPIVFEWNWPLGKYISQFDQQGFSYAPEAFVDILIELSEIRDRDDFFQKIVRVFLNDGSSAYQNFFAEISSRITAYNNGEPDVASEIQAIVDELDAIRSEVENKLTTTNMFTLSFLLENYVDNPALSASVNAIKSSLQELEKDFNIQIDIYGEVILALLSYLTLDEEKFRKLLQLFKGWIEDIDMEDIKDFLIPQFSLELSDINMALEFPRNWLVPAIPDTQNPGVYIEDPDTSTLAALIFTVGALKFSTKKGFEFEQQYDFDFAPAFIGKTGIMLEFTNLKVDFSDKYNIPEADADGRPSDFQGMYAEGAAVTLPARWFKDPDGTNATISGKNLLIGTGGISGTIGLEATGGDGLFWVKLGDTNGFKLGFHSFDIEFKQNKVLSSRIEAALEIKKFVYPAGSPNAGQPVEVGIKGHIHDDGSFNLTASTKPPYPIEFPDVFTYHMSTLELGGGGDDNYYIGTSGSIEFMGFLKDTLKLKAIDIDHLRIYSDGTIELEGGSIALAEPIVLTLGPVEITVSAIHYGSHQKEVNGVIRKFNYFGFDGGISVDPLGLEIRGDGVKFYYCADSLPDKPSPYLHIQTLYLDLTIPASSPVAIINGWLAIPEPGVSKEYAGGIKLQLPKVKIAGSADMKIMPRYPAFIIDVSIDLPAPITIGPVGIYGFRGLLGYRYVAEKEAAGLVSGVNSWYEYYKAPPRGIHVTKFNGPDKTKAAGTPFSIGVGASLGTAADNGTIVNIKAMLLLSIPSMFMIDGKAAILSARLGLDDSGEPPFFAFIAVGDGSLEFGIGADFKMPTSTGKTLTLYADIQAAFFFNDSSKWYVHIGTKTNPVTARVLTLVTITSYLMLSAKGIEAGARGEFDFRREYGPIKVHAWAYIEVGGKISFERPQFGAYLASGIGADITIKIASLYIALDVLFGVEASTPFRIYGEFRLCVNIKIMRVFKYKYCDNLSIMWEFDRQVDRTPVDPMISLQNQSAIPDIVKGVSMLSNETFGLAYLGSVIPATVTAAIQQNILPLDTYIDIKTEKGFLPAAVGALIGGVSNPPEKYTELIPPEKIINGKEVRQVKHQYSIENLVLKSWNPTTNSWMDYHPYRALYPADASLNALKIGQFQKQGGQYNTIRLLATTPFSYTEQGQPGWFVPEQNGITPATLFCEGEQKSEVCATFFEKPLGARYYCINQNQLFYSHQAAFLLLNRLDGDYAEVTDANNPHGFSRSLRFNNWNKLEIRLPQPSVMVSLRLSTYSQGVRIRYYASLTDDDALVVPYGTPDMTQPHILEYTRWDVAAGEIVYNNSGCLPVTRVEIEPLYQDMDEFNALLEQIAVIKHTNNLIGLGLQGGEQQWTGELEEQLYQLSIGCSLAEPEGCQQDEGRCYVYTYLTDKLQFCFAEPQNFDPEDAQAYSNCFLDARETILVWMEGMTIPQVQEQLYLFYPYYETWNQETYEMAYNALLNLIDYFFTTGNCNCTGEPVNACFTMLHSVCWLSLEDYEYNIHIPGQAAITADALAAIEGITQHIQPIWRPDTHYVVQFRLKDTLDNGSSSGTYTYTYGFTTAGPVGFFHKAPSADYGDPLHPELSALTSLTRYIDYNRSYPNADGNLLNSKPWFYDDETTRIYLYFAKAYATHFFHTWPAYNGQAPAAGRIKIVIKDPREGDEIINPPSLDYDENATQYAHIAQTIESWEDDPNPVVPYIFEQYENLINSNECLPFGGNQITPPSKYLYVRLKHLKPLKLYTAIVNNLYDLDKDGVLEAAGETTEVHKFTFQTSRFATFKQQVLSYLLTDTEATVTKEAIFALDKGFTSAELASAFATITGSANTLGDSIETGYLHRFDRVIEGILGLPPMDKAISTEFNVVRDTNDSNKIVALIIRSPEPFNNPKMPQDEVLDTITILDGLANEDTSYKKLFSKDYSQVIFMNTALEITGPLDLKFTYKIWDGNAYSVPGLPDYTSDEVGTIVISNLDITI